MSIKYCISFIFIVSLFSCKERIDIALAEDVNKLIIEGEVHDGAGPYYVKLSRSTKFGSSTTFLPHSPNSIIITDNEGNKDSLVKHADGIYKTTSLQGKVGNSYFLTVNDNSGVYTAESKLNSSPEIDSFYFFFFLTCVIRNSFFPFFPAVPQQKNGFDCRLYETACIKFGHY